MKVEFVFETGYEDFEIEMNNLLADGWLLQGTIGIHLEKDINGFDSPKLYATFVKH